MHYRYKVSSFDKPFSSEWDTPPPHPTNAEFSRVTSDVGEFLLYPDSLLREQRDDVV